MVSWSEISWVEAEKRLKTCKTAIIPLGSVEQHGPHLPLGTDWIIAQELAKRISEKTGAAVLPVLPFGYAEYHMDFPGTLTLTQDHLREVMLDVCRSVLKSGIKRILFVNGHGGNLASLRSVCLKLREEFGVLCAVAQWFDIFDEVEGWKATEHGGMIETCLMMGIRPDLVDLRKAIVPLPKPLSDQIRTISINRVKFRNGGIHLFLRTRDVTNEGSMTETEDSKPITDFSSATPEKGKEILNHFVEYLVDFCREFERTQLPS
jgi:creatinine amidohydrolase